MKPNTFEGFRVWMIRFLCFALKRETLKCKTTRFFWDAPICNRYLLNMSTWIKNEPFVLVHIELVWHNGYQLRTSRTHMDSYTYCRALEPFAKSVKASVMKTTLVHVGFLLQLKSLWSLILSNFYSFTKTSRLKRQQENMSNRQHCAFLLPQRKSIHNINMPGINSSTNLLQLLLQNKFWHLWCFLPAGVLQPARVGNICSCALYLQSNGWPHSNPSICSGNWCQRQMAWPRSCLTSTQPPRPQDENWWWWRGQVGVREGGWMDGWGALCQADE